MFKKANPFFLLCRSSLHCGSGNDIGIIDLPLQRERHTGFPKIEASGLKGGIREAFEDSEEEIQVGAKKVRVGDKETISLTFGPENGDAHAGSLGFTDARILLFPVKSMRGVFGWVTCPYVLERFKNELELCGVKLNLNIPRANTTTMGCNLFVKDKIIILEEYSFQIEKDKDENGDCTRLSKWLSEHIFPNDPEYKFTSDKLKTDIIVLEDDAFRDFVTLSTEVITRIKIHSETGTVQSGGLFTEEFLPPETILYSIVFASPIFKEDKAQKGIFNQNEIQEEDLVMEYFTKALPSVIQLGGDATIGKGIVRTKVM